MNKICLPVAQNANPCKPSTCWWWDVALNRDALAEWGWGWCWAEISQFLQGCGIASALDWQPRKAAPLASTAHTLAFLMLPTWACPGWGIPVAGWGFCWQQLTLPWWLLFCKWDSEVKDLDCYSRDIIIVYFCVYPTGGSDCRPRLVGACQTQKQCLIHWLFCQNLDSCAFSFFIFPHAESSSNIFLFMLTFVWNESKRKL